MNKKSQYYSIFMIFVFFILLVSLFYQIYIKEENVDNRKLGNIQMATLNTMHETEKALLYIDIAARLASQQAIYELAEQGGFKEKSECGDYGFNLWNNKDKECFPEQEKNLKSILNSKLNSFLVRFNLIDNYNLLIKQKKKELEIIGMVVSDLILDSYVDSLERMKDTKTVYFVTEYKVPGGADAVVKKIKRVYGDKILEEIEKNNPKPDSSLVIGVIAQESKGDPSVISPTGCAGLMQFCYGTATDYKDVFVELTPCSCTGNVCKTAPSCNIDNDGRFDADKSIEAGTKYLSYLLNLRDFRDKDARVEFAVASYNGGMGVIMNAIDETKEKTKNKNPSWAEVAQQLSPDMITYISSYDGKKNKVDEIIKYVNYVMGYKRQSEEIGVDEENLITGGVIGVVKGKYFLGRYSVKPSFKVILDYNINEYDIVKDQAKNLIEKCTNKREIKLCIDNEIKDVANYVDDCELESEVVVNDFVEFYQRCNNADIYDCYCSMNVKYKDEHEFEVVYEDGRYYIDKKNFENNDADFINYYKVDGENFELRNNDKKIKGDKDAEFIIYKEKISGGMLQDKIQLFFGKKDGDKLELFDRDIEESRECDVRKRKFKFCYKSDKYVLTKDGLKNPIIKFALMFPDTIAPVAVDVNVFDNLKAEQSIIVKWKKSNEVDVVRYAIYFSENDFKDKKIVNHGIKGVYRKDVFLDRVVEIDRINLNECLFRPIGKKCEYLVEDNPLYGVSLENGGLYFDGEGYLYVLSDLKSSFIENGKEGVYSGKLEDEKEYNILVTAIDDSGNEINVIEDMSYKSIISLDDLVPLVKDLDYDGNKLSWKVDDVNMDGSVYNDLIGFRIYKLENANVGKITEVSGMTREYEISIDLTNIDSFGVAPLAHSAEAEDEIEWESIK